MIALYNIPFDEVLKNAYNSPPLRRRWVNIWNIAICDCGEFAELSAALRKLSAIVTAAFMYQNFGIWVSKLRHLRTITVVVMDEKMHFLRQKL